MKKEALMPVYQAVYCHTPEENLKSQITHIAGWNQLRMEKTGGA